MNNKSKSHSYNKITGHHTAYSNADINKRDARFYSVFCDYLDLILYKTFYNRFSVIRV